MADSTHQVNTSGHVSPSGNASPSVDRSEAQIESLSSTSSSSPKCPGKIIAHCLFHCDHPKTENESETLTTQPYQCMMISCQSTGCQQSTVRSANYCADHICKANSTCLNSNENGYYCLEHRCEGFTLEGPCQKRKLDSSQYCGVCLCRFPNCQNSRLSQGNLHYCLEHRCEGFTREGPCQRRKLTLDSSQYCGVCLCRFPNCQNSRLSEGNPHCQAHQVTKKCQVIGCTEILTELNPLNQFCDSHRCINISPSSYYRCYHPRVTNIDKNGHVYGFYCAACMCTELIDGENCDAVVYYNGKCQYHYSREANKAHLSQCRTDCCSNDCEDDSLYCSNCKCLICQKPRKTDSQTRFCVYHACIKPDCVEPVITGSFYCDHHKCQYHCEITGAGCQNSRHSDNSNYCRTHVCLNDGERCERLRHPYYLFCDVCVCESPGCSNVSLTQIGSTYCLKHTCTREACPYPISPNSTYCIEHRCQQGIDKGFEVRCRNTAIGELYYCSDHVCHYEDCENQRGQNSNLCDIHEP